MATQTRDFFDNPKSKGNQSDRLSPPPAIGKRCCSWERKRTEKDIHKIGPHRVISLLKCKVTHISSGGSRLLLKWQRQSHFWVQARTKVSFQFQGAHFWSCRLSLAVWRFGPLWACTHSALTSIRAFGEAIISTFLYVSVWEWLIENKPPLDSTKRVNN